MKKLIKKITILFLLSATLTTVNPICSASDDYSISILQEMPTPDKPDDNK